MTKRLYQFGLAILFVISSAEAVFALQTPVPLTPQLLENYVRERFVPMDEKIRFVARERDCLAKAIYHEARGEPEPGQWAVAQVIINRVLNQRYPDSVCAVVYQNAHKINRCQFSFACDGRPDSVGGGNRIDRKSWVKAGLIANYAYRQFQIEKPVNLLPDTTLFYHATRVKPAWASAFHPVKVIGAHIFYAPQRVPQSSIAGP